MSFDGPSIIIAYSHCIAHGYDMADALDQQRLAVISGYWPLYRYDPRKLGTPEGALTIDSNEPNTPLFDYMKRETRFTTVQRQNPERFASMVEEAEMQIRRRYATLKKLASPDLIPPARTAAE
jgi:pyruvate-ferredoxin/flavodoxin oxidoreductase